LLQAYLFELTPSRKQKRFVFLFRRRKGKPRLKQKERQLLNERNNEINYSNHSEAHKSYDNNGKNGKNQERIQGSLLDANIVIKKVPKNSIIYKYFKRFIREALRISSTNQKKASSDRHKKEAVTLVEADKERFGIIKLLKKILKSQQIR
jgi:phosphorylcholine metabolism protein LicD